MKQWMSRLCMCMCMCVLLITACATKSDLSYVSRTLEDRIGTLQSDMAEVQKTTAGSDETSRFLRQKVADIDADLIEIKDGIQQLRGAAEDSSMRMAALEAGAGKKAIDNLTARLDDVAFRLQFIENYLGIARKEAEQGGEDELRGGEGEKEKAYSEALNMFKSGNYAAAREGFQNFLKAYPESEYSDNAQYWVGECYFFEGQYEKAILEYERVIQTYPKGNKVPDALLKQAYSFLELGDLASTRTLLQRIINDYPNTNSARAAREKLMSIQKKK